ncbi:MAG: hypothetical protein KDD43_14255, partial [Bdellovibrionales bacterium]|nr:hypothetical protein [Bdellovibrionales bacterium]
TFRLQDAGKVSKKLQVKEVVGIDNDVDLEGIAAHLEAVKKAVPELRTVLIQPKGDSMYEQIITLMDHFKKVGMVDLGVAPL